MIIPRIGARKINDAILMILSECTTLHPACAMAAPANPPTSVCDELDGMPRYQVNKFHKMAEGEFYNLIHC